MRHWQLWVFNDKKNLDFPQKISSISLRFVSLIIEHLLEENYLYENLTTFNPFHITVASFKDPKADEVPLTSHMLNVLNLSTKETDKSLSWTSVQDPRKTKPKANKKKKKKQIPTSSQPKTSKPVRASITKETVAKSQHVEVLVATADTTKRAMQAATLKTFFGESGEDQGHPPPIRDSMSALNLSKSFVHPESAPRNDATGFLTSIADIENIRLCKDPQHPAHESQTLRVPESHSSSRELKSLIADNPRIVSLGSVSTNEVMEETLSNPESMPDFEILFVSGGEDDFDKNMVDVVLGEKVDPSPVAPTRDSYTILDHVSRNKPPTIHELDAMKLQSSYGTSSAASATQPITSSPSNVHVS
ncbi:hypothetical protein Tco_0276918 [Tanacetum coccineum]